MSLTEKLGKAARGKVPKFDRNSRDYDYESAKKAGIKPDAGGHWPSRDPKSGLIFKARHHPTFHKTVASEKASGYEMYLGPNNRDYSRKKRDLPEGMKRGGKAQRPEGMVPVKKAYKG